VVIRNDRRHGGLDLPFDFQSRSSQSNKAIQLFVRRVSPIRARVLDDPHGDLVGQGDRALQEAQNE
jgi:hypothetical protein